MRTEAYKLQDENKKLTIKLKDTSDREIRLDKELNKQTKLKRFVCIYPIICVAAMHGVFAG